MTKLFASIYRESDQPLNLNSCQRGRAHLGAEMADSRGHTRTKQLLQRSRAKLGTERFGSRFQKFSFERLQCVCATLQRNRSGRQLVHLLPEQTFSIASCCRANYPFHFRAVFHGRQPYRSERCCHRITPTVGIKLECPRLFPFSFRFHVTGKHAIRSDARFLTRTNQLNIDTGSRYR